MKSSFPSILSSSGLATVKRTFCFGVWGTSYFGDLQTSITGADSRAQPADELSDRDRRHASRAGPQTPVVPVLQTIQTFRFVLFNRAAQLVRPGGGARRLRVADNPATRQLFTRIRDALPKVA